MLSIAYMCLSGGVVMFTRVVHKVTKINGLNIKYRSIVSLQLFGVYLGIILFFFLRLFCCFLGFSGLDACRFRYSHFLALICDCSSELRAD